MTRFLAFLAWPLIEIGLFIWIGGAIGIGATLAWVVLTGVAGVMLLRMQAAKGAVMMRTGMQRGQLRDGVPVAALFRAIAGMLLILPGFFTDFIGILLLLPPAQALISTAVIARLSRFAEARFGGKGFGPAAQAPAREQAQPDVIDGEWIEVPHEANRNRRPSGWTEIDN